MSGGVGGFIAGEVDDCGGDLFRQADPAQRDVPEEEGTEIIAQVLGNRLGGRHAGQDCVAADVMFGLMHRNQLGEVVDRYLLVP